MASEKLENLIKASEIGELGKLVDRAQRYAALSETLSKALPAELAAGLVAASVRETGELVLIARSPAFAARLRFEAERLIDAARAAGERVTGCRVRVSHDNG